MSHLHTVPEPLACAPRTEARRDGRSTGYWRGDLRILSIKPLVVTQG
ncbi:MAG: hypothetical protein ACXVJS_02425 [Acidimicrobiia bacterium]